MHPVCDVTELLSRLGDDLRRALLPLAFQDTWHPVHALELAPDLPDGWFTLVVQTLGLTHVGDAATVPEAIQMELARQLAVERPRLYRELARKASDAAAQRGNIQRAITLLRASGDTARAEAVLADWVMDRNLASQFCTLRETLAELPNDWLSPRVQAAIWQAWIREGGEAATQARRNAQAVYEAGERNARLLYVLVLGHNFDGQHTLALSVADEALAAGCTGNDLLNLLQQRAMALGYLGRDAEHLAAAQALLDEATAQHHLPHLASAHASLGYAHEDAGDLETAEWHLQRALATCDRCSDWRQLVVVGNNYAQFLAASGRPTEAIQQLDRAEKHVGAHAAQTAWLTLTRAMVHHQYGMHAQALISTHLAAQAARAAHLPTYELTARLLAAERLALDGQPAQARRQHRAARALCPDDPNSLAQCGFTGAVLHFHAGAVPQALKAFQAAATDPALNAWDRPRALLHLIALQLQQGEDPSTTGIEEALAAAGTDAPLLTDLPALQPALTWLQRQPGWAQRLDTLFEAPTLGGSVPLRFELCGPLQVHGRDGAVRFPLKRAGELFVYLALHGPSSRRSLLVALLGEATEQKADLLKKVLKALREALAPLLPPGADPVTVHGGRYQLNPLFTLSTSWLPTGLFPAPGVRTSGPVRVEGPFLPGAQGRWAEDLQAEVHEQLLLDLEQREQAGDPTVRAALQVVRTL